MRELQRSIDHEKKLRQFMDIKKSEREEDEFTKQHKRKKGTQLNHSVIIIGDGVLRAEDIV